MSMYMLWRRMSQDPDVAEHQLSPGVVWRVLRFAKPYRVLISVFVVLVILMSALSVAPPLLFRQIIDNGILQGDRRVVIRAAGRDRRLRARGRGGVLPRGRRGSGRLTLHLELQAGSNAHHMIEAQFKAFARALRVAVDIDPDQQGVPSTKGTLT